MLLLQQVIDETLRLAGIAIWLMREAKEDVTYQGMKHKPNLITLSVKHPYLSVNSFASACLAADYTIPKGSFVVPFLSAVHLNEDVYENALSFDPWRWTRPENQEKRNWRSSPYFAPFGGGGRFCPGAELARLQIALFVHYFLTSFRWRQIKEDQMSFFPSARLLNGFQVQLTKL